MRQHASTQETANVVAGFDNQWDADDAVFGLRIAGFADRRIGYFSRTDDGRMLDLLARYHRPTAALIGGLIGAAIGAWAGQVMDQLWYLSSESPDLLGIVITCAIIGALFLGTAGGMMGLWAERPAPAVSAPGSAAEPFVGAVDAGDARAVALAILRKYGGHDLHTHGAVPVAGHLPGGQPA